MPDTPGNDPMCLDAVWVEWADAWMNKEDFNPTDPNTGGPWVMWRDTPYVHIMAPMPKYEPARMKKSK